MAEVIDLRSDTVTKPTPEMRQAMAAAEVGDDVYGEDPTVRALEEKVAAYLGKEDALFVTSGTQGNQVAIATLVRTGEEVIAEAQAHIFYYEAAAISVLAGAQVRQVPAVRGLLNPEDVLRAIRPVDVHQPRTALICLENTHNRGGGSVYPLTQLQALAKVGKDAGIPLHMDGARLFNAAVALHVAPSDIACHVDTVQVCFSKGLCAPIGSAVAGSAAFILEARQWRKRLGGGLRQAGVIAAPALLAMETMVERLAADHEHAKILATALAQMDGIAVDLPGVETNIIIANIEGTGKSAAEVLAALSDAGVRATAFGPSLVRFVTHHDVSREDILDAISRIHRVLA